MFEERLKKEKQILFHLWVLIGFLENFCFSFGFLDILKRHTHIKDKKRKTWFFWLFYPPGIKFGPAVWAYKYTNKYIHINLSEEPYYLDFQLLKVLKVSIQISQNSSNKLWNDIFIFQVYLKCFLVLNFLFSYKNFKLIGTALGSMN